MPRNYRDFLSLMRKNPQFGSAEYGYYLDEIQRMSSSAVSPVVALFIVDFPSRKYEYVSDNAEEVMGDSRAAYIEGGLEFMLHHRHDFEIYNTQMFPDEVNFMNQHPITDVFHTRFSTSYRYRGEAGDVRTILQQHTIIRPSGHTLPVGLFGYAQDITAWAEKGKIIQQIDRFDVASGQWVNELSKEYYPDIPNEHLLSSREIEILKWAIEGHGSKQIADRLHLSVHTVNTHRRNMLRKTNSRNMMELLRLAVELKLL